MTKREKQSNHGVTALADRCGCSHTAISKAAREGRLTAGVQLDGRHVLVTDIDAAERQWRALHPDGGVDGGLHEELLEARLRRTRAQAAQAELELDLQQGKYVEAEGARADLTTLFTMIRNRLLGIPAKARQRDHTLTAAQLTLIDDVVREALEELADEDAAALVGRNIARGKP